MAQPEAAPDDKLSDEIGRMGAVARTAPAPDNPRFAHFAKLAREALGVPFAAVTLIEAGRQRVLGCDGADLGVEIPRESAFCDRTIRGRDEVVIEDAATDPRVSDNPYVLGEPHIRAYLGAPVTSADGYNLGALCAIDLAPRRFEPAERALLARLAGLVSAELEAGATRTDPTSGVLGRAAWFERASAAMAAARVSGRPAALILAEIAGLAAINRRGGQAAGDELIALVGEALRTAAGPEAAVGRLGGDQFAAVLPGADDAAALGVAGAARAAVAAAPRRHLAPEEGDLQVGVAALVDTTTGVEAWLAVAELSLAFAAASPGGAAAAA